MIQNHAVSYNYEDSARKHQPITLSVRGLQYTTKYGHIPIETTIIGWPFYKLAIGVFGQVVHTSIGGLQLKTVLGNISFKKEYCLFIYLN